MPFMLSVIHKPFCAECRYAECCYAGRRDDIVRHCLIMSLTLTNTLARYGIRTSRIILELLFFNLK
jgi:hypothetical protein